MMNRDITSGTPILAETVELSLPEISALCVRAARGAGFSWGLADECGAAAAWLAEYGFAWEDITFECLSNPGGVTVRPAVDEWQNAGPVCGLTAGATFADFAALPEGIQNAGVLLGIVLTPALTLPFVARAAKSRGTTCEVLLDDVPWVHLTSTGSVRVHNAAASKASGTVRITPKPMSQSMAVTLPARTRIKKSRYAQLDAIALRMTVPSSAQSQARAGEEELDQC